MGANYDLQISWRDEWQRAQSAKLQTGDHHYTAISIILMPL